MPAPALRGRASGPGRSFALRTSPHLDRRLFAVGGGQILGVTAYAAGSSAPFDPTVPGLDHIGLRCTDRDEVVAWQRHAQEVGVDSDLQEADFGTALMVKDPDGNQVEFFAGPVPSAGPTPSAAPTPS